MVKTDLMENLPVFSNKFIITSKQDVPEQLHFGRQSERHDLITTQEHKKNLMLSFLTVFWHQSLMVNHQ